MLLLALYVDDGLLASTSETMKDTFIHSLQREFKITVKPASYFLGLEIEKKEAGTIQVNQSAYTKKILERFGMQDCGPVSTPIVKEGIQLGKEDEDELNSTFPYREAVGSTDLGIIYKPGAKEELKTFSDADHGGDDTTGRSTTGVLSMYADGAISWYSQRQTTVAISTTEAEVVAASEAAREIVWLKRLFEEIIVLRAVPTLMVDNEAAIKLAENPEYHRRTKHIHIRHFFVQKEHYSTDLFEKKRQGLSLDGTNVVPAAVIMQFLLLYKRNLLTITRCWSTPLNRVLAHIGIGIIFGYLYKNVGGAAETILANYVYLYGTLLLTVYTGEMPVTLSFPLEMKILTREHFNRWYKLTPYLLSVILIEIPFQVMCVWFYIAISYWLTDQPLDFRIFLFVLFVTACSLCAQSMGYFIGATTPVKVAVFIAPVIACFLSVFGFCIRSFDTPIEFKWIFTLSYYRAAFQSLVFSMYGINRQKLTCSDESEYCHYAEPMKFLNEMDIVDIDLVSNFSLIVLIWCLMHAATYLTLWIKLNKR
ncbi:hypothetical protein JTB14_019295 [Gonioctena quinquepunctata]|nr:hypothetical protein JTB14_019295 [Gonioctena quinquepunctata]